MIKNKSIFLIFIMVITTCLASRLPDNLQATQNRRNQFNALASFQDKYEEVERLVKNMNDPRIVYKYITQK